MVVWRKMLGMLENLLPFLCLLEMVVEPLGILETVVGRSLSYRKGRSPTSRGSP